MSLPPINIQTLSESLQLTQLLFEKTALAKHLAEQLFNAQNEKEVLIKEIERLRKEVSDNTKTEVLNG